MRYRRGIVVFVVLSSLLDSAEPIHKVFGNTIPGTSITTGDAIGIVVGSAVAITVVTVILVHNAHPTLKGCVTPEPPEMLLHNDGDQKTYALSAGTTASVKDGGHREGGEGGVRSKKTVRETKSSRCRRSARTTARAKRRKNPKTTP